MCTYFFLVFRVFLETDRFKCDVCAVPNMVIEMYDIMFEMDNKGEMP